MRLFALFIACSLLLGAFRAEGAPLLGVAEWRYGQYRAESDGEMVTDASHFTQQYSLLYQSSGKLANGRAGQWDLALGAEWTAIDTEVNGADLDLQTEKFFYNGDLLIAPGGLPFRLHLYSHDMHRTQLLTDTILPRGSDRTGFLTESILDPGIVTDLNNGQHVVTGGTLLVGISNGSYLGRYRNVLAHLPRLLVDYKQELTRNLESFQPQHSLMRDLAFVSLNKKSNWFHYRYSDYTDYLIPGNDYTERKIILGTIDPHLARQWINLTNWVKISADGTLTHTQRPQILLPTGGPTSGIPESERYDLNFFALAKRSRLDAAAYPNFHRIVENQGGVEGAYLRKEIEVPLFVQGELDRNTAWRFNFLGTRLQDLRLDMADNEEEVLFATARVETFRQRRYTVAPQLEAELKQGDKGEGHAVRAGVEVFSTRSNRPRYDLFGAYSFAHFAGTALDGTDVDFWENEAKLRIEANLDSRARTGLEEQLSFGSGTLDRSITDNLTPRSDRSLTFSRDGIQQRQGDVLRSVTTWFGEYKSARRLENRVEVIYDFLATEEKNQDNLIFDHVLRYDQRRLLASMSNQLIIGDNQLTGNDGSVVLDGAASPSVSNRAFLHRNSLRYLPSRAWEAELNADYDWRDTDAGSTSKWRLNQTGFYHIFTINGVVRKLAGLAEEIEYERFAGVEGTLQTATTFTLRGEYFPTRWLLLGGKFRYRTISPQDFDESIAALNAALHFAKLTVSLDYSYGMRTASNAALARDEHRWEASLKKIF
jgi:hypothetical protein